MPPGSQPPAPQPPAGLPVAGLPIGLRRTSSPTAIGLIDQLLVTGAFSKLVRPPLATGWHIRAWPSPRTVIPSSPCPARRIEAACGGTRRSASARDPQTTPAPGVARRRRSARGRGGGDSRSCRQGRPRRSPVRSAAPSHTLATPQKIGPYTFDQQAEQQLGLSHGEQYLTQIDPGHVFGMVAAVYDTGGPTSTPNRVAVIAGRLVNSFLADVIKSFTQQEAAEGNAPMATAAGPLGGKAACAGKGGSGICVWADRNTVGVVVSATASASSLARVMFTIRSASSCRPLSRQCPDASSEVRLTK